MEYVYKYVDRGITKYVGITNNLSKRIYEHTRDKLSKMKKPEIYFFPVMYRADADMLETYLIDYYDTKKYFNVAKTNKGQFSFFDICDRLPWVLYNGAVDDSIQPFSVQKVIGSASKEIIYKEVVTCYDKDSDDYIIQKFWNEYKELEDYLNSEIESENLIINFLQKRLNEAIINQYDKDECEFIKKGLYLHRKRLQGFKLYKKVKSKSIFFFKKNNYLKTIAKIVYKINLLLQQHEGQKYVA